MCNRLAAFRIGIRLLFEKSEHGDWCHAAQRIEISCETDKLRSWADCTGSGRIDVAGFVSCIDWFGAAEDLFECI
jgi:hypothetical protein